MFQLFMILAIIIAILLVLIVLMQNSKGGGLSGQFGGSGAQQVIGVKKTSDILEKTTWVFIVLMLSFSLASSLMVNSGKGNFVNPNIDAAQQSVPAAVPQVPLEGQEQNNAEGVIEGTTPIDTTQEQN